MPEEKTHQPLPLGGIDPFLLNTLNDMLDASRPSSKTAPLARGPIASAGKPSLAVLPFTNISNDPEQEFFADGLTEDILTELSRFRNLFVIARNTSFSFKGKGRSIEEIGSELGVEYVVSGSVRRSGNRVRVAAQLIHAFTGQEIWAERYDRELEDIFKVQDEVVRTIVITLESRLGMVMANDAGKRDSPNLAAYECLLLARKHLHLHNADQARPLVERALEIDPNYANAHAMLARTCFIKYLENSSADTLEKMHLAALKAVALDEADSRGHAILGMYFICEKQFDLARQQLEWAIRLNPADTFALGTQAEMQLRTGDAAKALETMDQLFLRDPNPHPGHWDIRATALLMLGRFEEAISAMSRVPQLYWYIHGTLAICHARLGRANEAKAEIDKLLLLRPGMTIHNYLQLEEFQRQEDLNYLAEGLRIAGLPE